MDFGNGSTFAQAFVGAVKRALLMGVLPFAVAQDLPDSITLDPRVMTAALEGRRVEVGAFLRDSAECAVAARWREAMQSMDSEKGAVLLLALLQELNANVSMASRPDLYAEALGWHRAAAVGREDACLLLSRALDAGRLPNGLVVPRDGEMARRVARRVW